MQLAALEYRGEELEGQGDDDGDLEEDKATSHPKDAFPELGVAVEGLADVLPVAEYPAGRVVVSYEVDVLGSLWPDLVVWVPHEKDHCGHPENQAN